MNNRVYARPNRGLVAAEAPRALSEIANLVTSAPFLLQAPRGDGHSVLVMPGFGAGDRSTGVLRGFLGTLGYSTHTWNMGTNRGPLMPDLAARLASRLDEVFEGGDSRKVSLLGWSLGGVYARVLSHLYPEKVRQVITLGSPFNGHPSSTTVYPIVRMMGAMPNARSPVNELRLLAGDPLPGIPSSAIFSKTDGIVPWQIATQTPSAIAENIEVFAGHIGLGFSGAVLYACADRLAQAQGQWRPFKRQGWKRVVYGPANLKSATAT